MFGDGATAHIRVLPTSDAKKFVSEKTKIMATRVSHERLARTTFPNASGETARYAMMKPGTCAILLHYRGPQVPDTGELPADGITTFYLIEAVEYQEHE